MSVKLKIKNKHLAEEAKIIRFEERKLAEKLERQLARDDTSIRWFDRPSSKTHLLLNSINYHRIWDVRNEQRATFLARAYLAGKPYNSVEQKCHDEARRNNYVAPRVVAMVQKYGKFRKVEKADIINWFEGK